MAVKITNLTDHSFVVPIIGGPPLKGGVAKDYPDIEYDKLINNPSIKAAIADRQIDIENLDLIDGRFASAWNEDPKLTLGEEKFWFDSNGDLRVNTGEPTSDFDGRPIGSATHPVEHVYSDYVSMIGWTLASVRTNFFNMFHNKTMGTWDTLWKYCLWSFSNQLQSNWTTPTRFATQADFFTFLESFVPNNGTFYSEGVHLQSFEEVDQSDAFPRLLRHRNSLVASILPWQSWSRKRNPNYCYGVNGKFNAPNYFLNFFGELAQRFVQLDTGVLPATNNDNAIWHTRQSRNLWNLPKIGQAVTLPTGTRPGSAVWNTSTLSWVTPAPQDYYVFQQPMTLYENARQRFLSQDKGPTPSWRQFAYIGPAALVYPVIGTTNPNHRAYVIYPHSADTFITEKIDLATYELCFKLVYNHDNRPRYFTLNTPWQATDGEHHMWSHFVELFPGYYRSFLAKKAWQSLHKSMDHNMLPSKVYLSRRNTTTNLRSPWVPLYTIKRRIPQTAFRIEPARMR